MSRTLDLPKDSIKFPHLCMTCGAPAAKEVLLKKSYFYNVGRGGGSRYTFTLRLVLPVCELHYNHFMQQSPVEALILGRTKAVAIGFGALGALFILWRVQVFSQDAIFLGIFLALLVGAGLSHLFAACATILASFFELPESREVRQSIHLKRYSIRTRMIRIEFESERFADQVLNMNRDSILVE